MASERDELVEVCGADQQALPQRIQMTRRWPWRAEHPEAVIVARPSKWGNPIDWKHYSAHTPRYMPDGELNDEIRRVPDADRRRWAVSDFKNQLVYGNGFPGFPTIDEIRAELAGKDLACWCPLDQPCHADVLLNIANNHDKETTHGR